MNDYHAATGSLPQAWVWYHFWYGHASVRQLVIQSTDTSKSVEVSKDFWGAKISRKYLPIKISPEIQPWFSQYRKPIDAAEEEKCLIFVWIENNKHQIWSKKIQSQISFWSAKLAELFTKDKSVLISFLTITGKIEIPFSWTNFQDFFKKEFLLSFYRIVGEIYIFWIQGKPF